MTHQQPANTNSKVLKLDRWENNWHVYVILLSSIRWELLFLFVGFDARRNKTCQKKTNPLIKEEWNCIRNWV